MLFSNKKRRFLYGNDVKCVNKYLYFLFSIDAHVNGSIKTIDFFLILSFHRYFLLLIVGIDVVPFYN